jgi:putative transcriptional regulator
MNDHMIKTRIDDLLRARNKSLYALAQETGIAYTTLWKFRESKTKAIYFDVLESICEALDCTPGDLLVRVPGEKKAARRKDRK